MKSLRMFIALMVFPLIAWAQGYRNLDEANAGLSRGFGGGDAAAIVSGIAEGDRVQLSFPGLVEESGFFGRDQASYLLENLFSKAKPVRFRQTNIKKNSSEGQYIVIGSWTITRGNRSEERDLYITLRITDDRYSVVSIRSENR